MSSQLVDIDADGYNDILSGSFSGSPYIIHGSEEGFSDPEPMTDANGEIILIADFWNLEDEKWDKADRAKSAGHCTSVAAVDWDADGDLDLLLGDYYGGRLYLQINEGTPDEPGFAGTNVAVEAGGKPIVIAKGLAAPRVVDWNGDGLFDILCGGSKGGVYFFANTGETGKPEFAAAKTLIKVVDDPADSFQRRVPSRDGQPLLPGSSYHIEPVDFDGDGDLDLLVGGRSSWLTGPVKKLTTQEQEELEDINMQYEETITSLQDLINQAEKESLEEPKAAAKEDEVGDGEKEVEGAEETEDKEEDADQDDAKSAIEKAREARKKMTQSEEYKLVLKRLRELSTERAKYKTDPVESGDFVWLYRRK